MARSPQRCSDSTAVGTGGSPGVVVSYSEGQGAYTHYELNERTSFWGVLGYGVGELSLTPQRSATALSVRTGGRPGADPEHAVQLRGALRW